MDYRLWTIDYSHMQNIEHTTSTQSNSWLAGGKMLGLIYLLLNLIISVAAQVVLKAAMDQLSGFEPGAGALDYFLSMLNPMVIGGLLLYGSGTILWLLCLTKLDLSFAYPAATLQYFLVFWSSWYFLGETISWMRIGALVVITVGVIVMSLDKEEE